MIIVMKNLQRRKNCLVGDVVEGGVEHYLKKK
jgi:hypothetical protein